MKKLILLLVLMSSNISIAQEQGFTKPDYNGIQKAIQQPNTPLFYKRLMERFHEGDSSMTLQQNDICITDLFIKPIIDLTTVLNTGTVFDKQ